MAFFEDLTPYSYFPTGEVDGFDTVNIGWLDSAQPFLIGETSEEFQLRLATLCSRKVNQTRGFQSCPFCLGPNRPNSSAEMRVTRVSRTYAAPSLIDHYVAVHGYRPPDEFIAAVLAVDC